MQHDPTPRRNPGRTVGYQSFSQRMVGRYFRHRKKKLVLFNLFTKETIHLLRMDLWLTRTLQSLHKGNHLPPKNGFCGLCSCFFIHPKCFAEECTIVAMESINLDFCTMGTINIDN
ncbi:hypothetical protein ACLOJK_009005 [Asimina triloba]